MTMRLEQAPETAQRLRRDIEEIADRLCYTVDGRFDQPVSIDTDDESVQKLLVLVNTLLDASRRAVAQLDVRNRQLEEQARALERSRKTLHQILTHAPIGVALIDLEQRFRWVNENACRMAGVEHPEEIVGRYCHELVCGHARDDCPFLATEARREVRIENAEERLRRADGAETPILKSAMPIVIDGEELILETFIDITQRKQLEMELAQAHKLESIGQLAAGIAHEINTPTQFIGDNLRFLEAELPALMEAVSRLREAIDRGDVRIDDDLRRAFLELDIEFLADEVPGAISQALDGVERVTRIVRAMKEFSHPSRGMAPVDLNHAIESTVTVARNEWKYVADLELDLDPDLPAVQCIGGDINQVILNMVVNAAHAIGDVVGDSGEKGRIRIATRRDGDHVEIRISDTGCGIPEEIRDRIFDPFFTTKEVGRGTGQGLAIAHNVVVKKHGGTIDCQSTVGRGTTFIIRLPLGHGGNGEEAGEP